MKINSLSKFVKASTTFLAWILFATASCQTVEDARAQKTKCYQKKLEQLKKTQAYKNAMGAFADTFLVLKNRKEFFGVPTVVESSIDESLFFNSDSSKCMLIVLQRNNVGLVFGTARMIRGQKKANRWQFDVSLSYTFEKGYYKLYSDNTFDNIAQLARYNVLTDGNISSGGCEIDRKYWFEELTK